jgi:hypothetical protein
MYVNIKYILEKIFSCYFLSKDSNGFAESEGGQDFVLPFFGLPIGLIISTVSYAFLSLPVWSSGGSVHKHK